MTGKAASIALIGYGAIAQEVCQAFAHDPDVEITQIIVRKSRQHDIQRVVPKGVTVISKVRDIADDVQMVVECAGHDAVRTYATDVLARGLDLAVASVGVLADNSLYENLRQTARAANAQLIVVPGAIGGIDALAAAGNALDKVSYTSRKPPLSWLGSPAENSVDLHSLETQTVLFEGTAREAAIAFPKNANVVATVALASIGLDKTTVTLLADPEARGNTHEIFASGDQFDFHYETSGAALATNPKTSALTAHSIVRCIRARVAAVVI